MKPSKMMAFLLFLMLTMHLSAENIQQSFSADFGPAYAPSSPVEQQTDGWRYYSLYHNLAASSTYKVLYGEAAVCLFASSNHSEDAYLISPAKTGGVGWISFWYKMSYQVTNTDMYPLELIISTSEDGENFSEVETVSIPPLDDRNFLHYSKVVNNLNAVYVKITAKRPSTASVEINLDEFIITDAVASGVPAHITSVTGNTTIGGELNQTTPADIIIKGAGLSGDVTFAIDGDDSPFSLPTTSAAASSITESGYTLPVQFAPVEKGYAYDIIKLTVSGLPELVFPLRGAALERTITEDFNVAGSDNSPYLTFEYHSGWQVEYGGTVYAGANPANAIYILEGDRSLTFRTSLTSPRKMNGVGTIFFMYRAYNPIQRVEFFTETSDDGIVWDLVDNTIATGSVYVPYIKTVNRPDAQYVRIRIDATSQQNGILVDEFIITENDQSLPFASGAVQIVSTESDPLAFSIPLTFSDITSDVSLAIDDPQFTLSKTSLTPTEAAGTYTLTGTYTPEAGKGFTEATLTISGGDLYFPMKIRIYAYLLVPTLFSDFDAMWGGASAGSYSTDAGWMVENGSRYTFASAFNSPASVNLGTGGSLTSPPKSQGIGSIHFLARSSWLTATYTVSVSDDGTTWTPVASNVAFNNDTSFGEVEYEVNSATAKFVRLELASSGSNLYVDNFTVTPNGKGIPHVTLVNAPSFLAKAGEEVEENMTFSGDNIESDIQIRFKLGNAFSLNGKTSITAAEINDSEFDLPVYFQSATGAYFNDTLIVSGDDFTYERIFPVRGYNMQDLIYQDFNGAWIRGSSYSEYNVGGWEVHNGSESTYDVIDGRAHLQLSAGNGELVSIPKSGGVGAVSFKYRTESNAIPVKISIFKTPTGTPLAEIDTLLAANQPVTTFDYVFNEPEAVYVKIQNLFVGWGNFYLDNVAVTANGKGTPAIIADAILALHASSGETVTGQLNISAANIDDEVTLTLKHGDYFSIDKNTFTAAGALTEEVITVTYQATGALYVVDTLLIESASLLKSQLVILRGNILKDLLVEDFNQTGWSPNDTEGNYVVDGWTVTNGTRVGYSSYNTNIYEGAGALRLSSIASSNRHGSLTSPAKSGGVGLVEFYYHSEILKFYLQTSADGNTWTDNDSVIVPASFSDYQYYSIAINDPAALYFRIQTADNRGNWSNSLYIDSIAVGATLHLSPANAVAEEQTTEEVPLIIPVELKGFLNTNAFISQDDDTHFTLSASEITPEDVEDGARFILTVTFTANEKGVYPNEIRIVNDEDGIEPVIIPLTVTYSPTGIDKIAGGSVSVYLSNGILNVNGALRGTDMTVLNIQGQSIFRTTLQSAKEQFNLQLATGVYLVKVGNSVWKVIK